MPVTLSKDETEAVRVVLKHTDYRALAGRLTPEEAFSLGQNLATLRMKFDGKPTADAPAPKKTAVARDGESFQMTVGRWLIEHINALPEDEVATTAEAVDALVGVNDMTTAQVQGAFRWVVKSLVDANVLKRTDARQIEAYAGPRWDEATTVLEKLYLHAEE